MKINLSNWLNDEPNLSQKDYDDALMSPPSFPQKRHEDNSSLIQFEKSDNLFFKTVFSWFVRLAIVLFFCVCLVFFLQWFVGELSVVADKMAIVMPKLREGLKATFWCAVLFLGIYAALQVYWLDQKLSE